MRRLTSQEHYIRSLYGLALRSAQTAAGKRNSGHRRATSIEQEFRNQLQGSKGASRQATVATESAQLFGDCSSSDYAGVTSATSLFRKQIGDPVSFYFGTEGLKVCRLCNEVCMVPQNHLGSMGHIVSELVIDLIEPNCRRGEDLRELVSVWQRRLLRSATRLDRDKLLIMTMEQRCCRLRQFLAFLRDVGIAPVALYQPTEEAGGSKRGAPFQRLECIGDHNWGASIARRIRLAFPHIDWMNPVMSIVFDTLRSAAESNSMLEHVCDVIGLQQLLPMSLQESSMKFKADVVEGLLGELYLAFWSCCPASMHDGRTRYVDVAAGDGGVRAPLASVIDHTVQEILDIIVIATLSRNMSRIVPLLRDYTVGSRFLRLEGPSDRKKRHVRCSGITTTGVTCVLLPGIPQLHRSPTPPCAEHRRHHGTFLTRVALGAMQKAAEAQSLYSGWEMAERGAVALPFVTSDPSPVSRHEC
jgi:hypothetical protein